MPSGDLVAGRLGACHPDRWVRVLLGLRENLPLWNVEMLALPGEFTFGPPDLGHDLHGLLHDLASVPGVDAQAQLLVRTAAPDAELHAPAGKMVHHGQTLCHLHGMVMRQHDDAKAQADAAGQPGQ